MSKDATKPAPQTPSKDSTANAALSPEKAELRRRQLEILNLFRTIDFDPDRDPIKLRERDREQLKQQTAHRR